MNLKTILMFASATTLLSAEVASMDKAKKVCKEEGSSQTPFKQGEPLPCDMNLLAGFNRAAVYDVRPEERVSGYVDASFIYWYLGQEGMDVATNGVLSSSASLSQAITTKAFPTSSKYQPGFKAGAGLVFDHEWQFHGEYTWIRSEVSKAANAPTGALTGTSVWMLNDWFTQATLNSQVVSATNISTEWELNVDIADLELGRPFYQSKCITISPYAGLRGMWIRQMFEVLATEPSGLFNGTGLASGTMPVQPIGSFNRSHCWSVGPRFGSEGSALLPYGFRLQGEMAASLLYARYKVTHKEKVISTNYSGPLYMYQNGIGVVRPVVEAGLGAGWGMYCGTNNCWHIDFSATYDFTYLWSQNMMRKMLDDTFAQTTPALNDLFFHGLTATARFDF